MGNDSWEELSDGLSFSLSDDDESIVGDRSQDFWVFEVQDALVILEHVDLFDSWEWLNSVLLNDSLESLVISDSSLVSDLLLTTLVTLGGELLSKF